MYKYIYYINHSTRILEQVVINTLILIAENVARSGLMQQQKCTANTNIELLMRVFRPRDRCSAVL